VAIGPILVEDVMDMDGRLDVCDGSERIVVVDEAIISMNEVCILQELVVGYQSYPCSKSTSCWR
jgi:hypothetical protein